MPRYSAMATITAPPTIAATSRVRPRAVMAAAPVCRPGAGEVGVGLVGVSVGGTMVVEVTVLTRPLGRVVVLLKVEVVSLVVEVDEVVVGGVVDAGVDEVGGVLEVANVVERWVVD